MSTDRTIARLWRDAVAPRAHRHRVPRPARRSLARGHLGGGGRARREPRQRPARPWRPQGRRLRDARAHDARVGAVRLRTGPGRRRRRARLRRTARRRTSRTCSSTRSRSACSARTPSRWPRSRASARRSPGLRHVLDLRRPRRARGRGRAPTRPRTRRRSTRPSPRSTRTTSSRSSTRRGRPGRRRAA